MDITTQAIRLAKATGNGKLPTRGEVTRNLVKAWKKGRKPAAAEELDDEAEA